MYRQVIVQREARVYQKENQLVIENETAHRIPIEDIDTLVIANRRVNISAYCLDSLMANGSSVVICGKNYHPTGIVLPFAGYSRKLKMLRAQIDQPKPRLKQLWRTIVQQKILNQGKCLQLAGRKDVVSALSEQVRSGDKGNVEGWAAGRYFPALFGEGFERHEEDFLNGVLNFGYAIIRSSLARFLAAYGFEPSLGIFHHSETNAFNLADDLLEPFRPVVDLYASTCEFPDTEELTPAIKRDLVGLLSVDILYGKERMSVDYAAEQVVQNLRRCYLEPEVQLQLPQLLPLQMHKYE